MGLLKTMVVVPVFEEIGFSDCVGVNSDCNKQGLVRRTSDVCDVDEP